jgi:hypothetical protein
MTGYLSHEYAESLGEWGSPLELPRCGGWLLAREIEPGLRDAMGLYPRFCCRNWQHLRDDLQALVDMTPPLISLALVTDPFAEVDETLLNACFPDRLVPFKTHFVVDLDQPTSDFITSHHRYYTRVSLRTVRVEQIEQPATFLDEWDALYTHLAQRHQLSGIKRFSRAAFTQQLLAPGMIAFRAVDDSGTVGGQLWYVDGNRAYNHLAAFTPAGYKANASYALYDYSLSFFAGRVRWLDLGAGAGLDSSGDDGLSRFKRGWSNATRQVYFCGRVLNRTRYDELTANRGVGATNYFPAYRSGEFQ